MVRPVIQSRGLHTKIVLASVSGLELLLPHRAGHLLRPSGARGKAWLLPTKWSLPLGFAQFSPACLPQSWACTSLPWLPVALHVSGDLRRGLSRINEWWEVAIGPGPWLGLSCRPNSSWTSFYPPVSLRMPLPFRGDPWQAAVLVLLAGMIHRLVF